MNDGVCKVSLVEMLSSFFALDFLALTLQNYLGYIVELPRQWMVWEAINDK